MPEDLFLQHAPIVAKNQAGSGFFGFADTSDCAAWRQYPSSASCATTLSAESSWLAANSRNRRTRLRCVQLPKSSSFVLAKFLTIPGLSPASGNHHDRSRLSCGYPPKRHAPQRPSPGVPAPGRPPLRRRALRSRRRLPPTLARPSLRKTGLPYRDIYVPYC